MPQQNPPEAGKKQINPFSEQEKHGDNVQGREPHHAQEYQGNPSVQRGDHAVKDDTEEPEPDENVRRRS